MRILRYILLFLLIVILVAAGALAVVYNQWTNGPLPQHEGTLRVAGLQDRVEVIRDSWGVPHIYASSAYDLFFAQGYTQAQDRWWQMEFFRHTGRGTLQELTGKTESLMGTDIFIRAVGWQRAATADWALVEEPERGYLQAFADGVNAYITNRPAGQLAFEYNILGITGVTIPIEPWSPVDTLVWTKVMSWDLSGNQDAERALSALIDSLGEAMAADYVPEYPFGQKPTIIQPEDLPDAGTTFADKVALQQALARDTAGLLGIDTALAGNFDATNGLAFGRGEGIGSNNWVVAGGKTASGQPLLANDPHLGIQMPSIWYEMGLHCQPVSAACPFDVRGLTFAPSPGIIIGHNGRIAWGVTNVGPDTQDLYRIKVNPDNPLQYEWDGDWRDMTVHEEVIRFGDSPDTLTLQIRETHLGPIINDHQRDDAGVIQGFNNTDPLALRWTAYENSTLLRAVFKLNQAQNFDDFRAALRDWDTPAQNFIYADVEGNIGYQTPGNLPIRAPGHTGLLPVDGSTSANEWLGYVPFDYLPSVYNPERNYIATANQALVPLEYYAQLAEALSSEYPADANFAFGYQWAYGHRGQRIVAMLEATDEHTFATFRAIQGDNKIIVAEEIAPYLRELEMGDAALNETRDWLLDWDYQMDMNSPQAALFGVFWLRLARDLYDDQLAAIDETTSGAGQAMWATRLLMDDDTNPWWDDISTDATETRDAIIQRAFKAAVDELTQQQGADRTKWAWGQLHTATFVSNPLGLSGIDLIENMVNRGPVATGGGSDMVNATGWRADDYTVRAVPSMRMIVDLSNLSNSQIIHTTGQSGHPFSPQYGSMIDPWRNIAYHPMLWTRAEVEANAAKRLILEPGG